MEPQLKISVLEDNRLVFGDSEVRLLAAIGRQGTLVDGAATLGLSYRVAWGKVRAAEASLGMRLVETTVGGSRGGSSRLTDAGRRIVERYDRFRDAVAGFALAEFGRCFGEEPDCSTLALSDVGGLAEGPNERLAPEEAVAIPESLRRRKATAGEATGESI